MANKKIFRIGDENNLFFEEEIEYKYYGGFARSQRQKCILSLHDSIKQIHMGSNILEISTKSTEKLGVELSAFNLKYQAMQDAGQIPVECIFQAAKHFKNGGPYRDLLDKEPKDAKRDPRLKESGELVSFDFEDKIWPLEPTTLFYDWIYINALVQHEAYVTAIRAYDIFTDIEFNHNKSFNCQARSAAIFRTLQLRGILEDVIQGRINLADLYGSNKL